MRLLLTRATEDAQATRAKLEAAGHTVLLSPVIEMVTTAVSWPSGVVDAVIATSAHAFDATGAASQPTPEARRLLPLDLVGERTCEHARCRGFDGPAAVFPDAAALIAAFETRQERPRRLIYLAGRDRKPIIEKALTALGQPVEVLEVYAAKRQAGLTPKALAALREQRFDAVLHYSRRSAFIFIDMAKSAEVDIRAVSHVCLSEDIADLLRQAACRTIRVASAPKEAALFELLEDRPQEA